MVLPVAVLAAGQALAVAVELPEPEALRIAAEERQGQTELEHQGTQQPEPDRQERLAELPAHDEQ